MNAGFLRQQQQAENEIVIHAKRQGQGLAEDAAEDLSDDGEGEDEEEHSAGEDDDISIKVGKKPENIDQLKER